MASSLLIFFAAHSVAASNESAQTFTLDGQLYQRGTTTRLLDASAKLTIQIISADGTCLLYEEQQTVNTLTTDGHFTVNVGSQAGAGKRTANDPGRSMNQIFQNLTAVSANSVPGQTCAGGAYTPSAGAVRYFRLIVTPSATNVADTLSPDIVIDSVPAALVAQSVQGLERANILQVNNSGSTVLTQANLESLFTTPAYANLQSILAGNFMPIDSSGASLPTYAADPAGAANGDIWFDSVTNEIKYKNAAGVQTVGVSSGGISSLTVGSSMSINGTVAGSISGSGTIDLSNTGVTAGTYTKMTVDTKGRVTAGTVSLVEADIPNLTVTGKVSGNTITSGIISGSAGINTSGNLLTTATVSGLTVQATNLRIYNGANYIQMNSPALGGNVTLTLPATDGNSGEFLKTDGSGVLSWATSTITSTDVTTALGYTPLNAGIIFAGDVSGTYNTNSVDKIKGKAITAGSVSGQMMIYNGSTWTNNVMSGDATLAHDGMFTLNKVPVSKGGTNATTFGNNRIIASNGTGTTLQDFTCSLNQVISFDASGNAACANVSSLSGGILNGGNTTGADISIGTNDNKALKFKVNNTVAIAISQDGRVGIGTFSPSGILDVQGGATSTANGMPITLKAQESTKAGATGGGVNISAGYGDTVGGSVTLSGGQYIVGINPATITLGGQHWLGADIDIMAGNNDSNAAPGKVTISSGTAANSGGGSVTITTGQGNNSTSGSIYIVPGLAGSSGSGNIVLGVTDAGLTRGLVGIGTASPSTALDVSGALNLNGMAAPAVSLGNQGRIYYDLSANKFKVSQNGAGYTDLVPSGGISSLGGQTGGTQTLSISVDNSVATPTLTSATNAHTWKIPMASNAGTAAGLLNKTDYDLFAAKLGSTTSFAGDVSGAYNTTVVQKIQGKDVTAASVSGQMMIYNGTAWTNNVMSGDATLAHDGIFTLNKVPVSKGGTNATTFGTNRIIASNGTGTALQDFTCSLNQVISFDASGNATCANVSSLVTGILNGGNTTGTDISIGTNDNYALKFKANNAVAMTISQNGFVGIGTSAPTAKLDVTQTLSGITSGNAKAAFISASSTNSGSSITNGIRVDAAMAPASAGTTGSTRGVYSYTTSNSGNISATATLIGVHGDSYYYGTGSMGNVYGVSGSASLTVAAGSVVNATGVAGSANAATGSISYAAGGTFQCQATGSGSVANCYGAIIDSATDSSSGSITTNYGLYIDNQTAGATNYALYSNGGQSYFSGSVGIGASTPSEKLDVVGNIKTSGCLYYASSSLGTCASDERIKEDIRPFDLGLNALLGIQPVHFKYNGLAGFAKDGKEQLGVIAQQVETVAPDLIKKQMVTLRRDDPEQTEIKVVDYGAFTYLIINSIKDLYRQWFHDSQSLHRKVASVQSEMAVKHQKIKALKQENENLKQENETIKYYLCQKDPMAPFCKGLK